MPEGVDLRPIIRAVEQIGAHLDTRIEHVEVELGAVHNDLTSTTQELIQLRREFVEFVAQAERTANLQRSETKLGTLKAELDRQFGHYAVVRRTSVGILQAFDVGNVTNAVVGQISEQLMIQTPRYWLAPALVALAAWSKDDSDMAEKSIQEAFTRDKNKTALFFALVLRRQGRQESSTRWLRHYLISLDPGALTREFAVILEAAAQGAFGPAARDLLAAQLSDWSGQLRTRQDVVDAQVSKWMRDIEVHRGRLDATPFATLAQVSPDWPAIQSQVERASALGNTRTIYEGVKADDTPRSSAIEDLLDGILEQLVTEFDEEELPLRREVAYHDAVVEERGDLDRARTRADQELEALEETIDVVSLQTTAAISPDRLGVSRQTQRVAIGVAQEDFLAGIGKFTRGYREAAILDARIELGPQHSGFARDHGFPGWSGTTAMPEEEALGQISQLWDHTFTKVAERLAFKNSWYLKPGGIAAGFVLILFIINWIAGLIALIVGGALVFFLGEQQKKKSAAELAALGSIRLQAVEESTQIFRDAVAQFVDARLAYQDFDRDEAALLTLVTTWPTAVGTADEERSA